jgi:hypothetical protein
MENQLNKADEKIWLYDEDVRDPLFDYLEERFGKIRIFEEKIIGKSRADMIMLTEDRLTGIEIKSDVDTYERLKRQVKDYDKYCDCNYVAVGKTHEKHVEKHVPETWGIFIVSVEKGEILIEEKRMAVENPKVKKERQITFLWRPELQRLLEKNKLPKYKQKSKRFVQQKLLEKMEWAKLKLQMCEELFERDYTLWDEEMEAYQKSKN